MEIWDELPGRRGVCYRQGHTRPGSRRRIKGGTSAKRNQNTTKQSLTGLVSEDVLNSLRLTASSLSSWGYVYQIDTQTIAVGANVTFSDNGPLNGINHTPGTATIEVTLGGTYYIVFSIYTTQNNPQGWAVVVNGIPQSEFSSAGQTMNAAATLTLDALDRVTIRNANTIPDPATLRTGDVITAYVMIYKVDS